MLGWDDYNPRQTIAAVNARVHAVGREACTVEVMREYLKLGFSNLADMKKMPFAAGILIWFLPIR